MKPYLFENKDHKPFNELTGDEMKLAAAMESNHEGD